MTRPWNTFQLKSLAFLGVRGFVKLALYHESQSGSVTFNLHRQYPFDFISGSVLSKNMLYISLEDSSSSVYIPCCGTLKPAFNSVSFSSVSEDIIGKLFGLLVRGNAFLSLYISKKKFDRLLNFFKIKELTYILQMAA